MKKYIIYADEAWTHDFPKRYHNFFGGFLAEDKIFTGLDSDIKAILKKHDFRWEIKWSKISLRNKILYEELVDLIFSKLEKEDLKYRQMFRDKRDHYIGEESAIEGQFKLFYQFIKYSFGLDYLELNSNVEIVIDEHSNISSKEKLKTFCESLPKLLKRPDLKISIKFMNSRSSRCLQCCDLLMGAAGYHGNKMYNDRVEGQRRISKLQSVRKNICKKIYNYFRYIDGISRNTLVFHWFESTSMQGNLKNRLDYKIAIWKFVPNHSIKDERWENDFLSKDGTSKIF